MVPEPEAPVPSVLTSLFERMPVVVVERPLPAEMPEIDEAEAVHLAGAVRHRQIEFATGRWCARRALAHLGISSFVLHRGPDRAPRWPTGIVGSITHTGPAPGGYCGVAVARLDQVRAVGVDAESADPLEEELWSSILTKDEERTLRQRADGPEGGRRAKIIFSAKECFYKAQFPLSGRFLDFHDVEVSVDPRASTFEACVVSAGFDDLPLKRCVGRLARLADLLVTGIAIAA